MLNKKNLIDVHINKAKLTSFAVSIEDKGIEINANLALFAGNKPITTVTMGSESWRSGVTIDIPISIHRSCGKITGKLEELAKSAFMQEMAQLNAENEVK